MNKKRLIFNSVISIVLVSILMLGNTYSIFTSGEVEEDINVYTTGNLDITYTLSSDNIVLNSKTPVNNKNNYFIEPYRITIHNNGTIPYQFNLILADTTASDIIDYNYIMIRVGNLDLFSLASARDNIIQEGVIVSAGKSVDIDVRVWLSDNVANTEIGKSFYAKLAIDGIAIYGDNGGYDNSNLVYPVSKNIFSNYLSNIYKNGNVTEFSLDKDSKVKVNLNDDNNMMLDNNNNYRYYGNNPNNYVSFNNELWRIVSLEKSYYDEKDITGINRVKLMRDKSIGHYHANREFISKLDDLYYNSIIGKIGDVDVDFTKLGLSNNARDMIDTNLYYLGNSSDKMVYDIYDSERKVSCDNLKCDNVITSKVGLIYLSDYLYAYDDTNNNYFSDSIATITNRDNLFLSINNNVISTDNNMDIYPVVYLKPDVIYVSGDGTRNNPYKIVNAIDI